MAVFLSVENSSGNDNNTADGDERAKFTTGRIFAALALFNQLTVPLFIFPLTVPIIISAIVSTRRLERFLGLQEVQKEFEGIRNMARVMSRSDASLDVFEIEDNESQSEIIEDAVAAGGGAGAIDIEMQHTTMLDEPMSNYQSDDSFVSREPIDKMQIVSKRPLSASVKLKKNNQLSSSTKMERNRSRQKSVTKEIQMEISSDLIVSIRNGAFSWMADSSEASLKIDSLEIPKGKHSNNALIHLCCFVVDRCFLFSK